MSEMSSPISSSFVFEDNIKILVEPGKKRNKITWNGKKYILTRKQAFNFSKNERSIDGKKYS